MALSLIIWVLLCAVFLEKPAVTMPPDRTATDPDGQIEQNSTHTADTTVSQQNDNSISKKDNSPTSITTTTETSETPEGGESESKTSFLNPSTDRVDVNTLTTDDDPSDANRTASSNTTEDGTPERQSRDSKGSFLKHSTDRENVNSLPTDAKPTEEDRTAASDISGRTSESQSFPSASDNTSDSQPPQFANSNTSDSQPSHFANGSTSDSQSSKFANGSTSDSQPSQFANGSRSDSQTFQFANGSTSNSQPSQFARDNTSDSQVSQFANGSTSDSQPSQFANGSTSDSQSTKLASGSTSDSQSSKFANGSTSDSQSSQFANGSTSDSQPSPFANDSTFLSANGSTFDSQSIQSTMQNPSTEPNPLASETGFPTTEPQSDTPADSYSMVPVPQCPTRCSRRWLSDMFKFKTIHSCTSPRNFSLATTAHFHSPQRCFCDSMCLLLGDCCYDYFTKYLGTTDVQEISMFVDAYLNSDDIDRDFRLLIHYGRCVSAGERLPSTLMIAVCPEDFPDQLVREKCENTSMAAPFNIPVTHRWSKDTVFSSIFCSRCHGVKDTDVELWRTEHVCEDVTNDELQNMDAMELKRTIRNCKMDVLGPPTIPLHARYRMCNDRGVKETILNRDLKLRTNHSTPKEELEFWCQTYVRPVEDNTTTKYVNPHCLFLSRLEKEHLEVTDEALHEDDLLCSTLEREVLLGGGLPVIPTFSDLFSLSDAVHPVTPITEKLLVLNHGQCSQNEVFDRYLQKCHKIHCSSGLKLTNGSCHWVDDFLVDHRTQMLPNGSETFKVHFVLEDEDSIDGNAFLQAVQVCLADVDLDQDFPEVVHQLEFRLVDEANLAVTRYHSERTHGASDELTESAASVITATCLHHAARISRIVDTVGGGNFGDKPALTVAAVSIPAVEVSFRSTSALDLVFRVATVMASEFKSCAHTVPASIYLTNAADLQNLRCPLGEERVLSDVDVVYAEKEASLDVVLNGTHRYFELSYVPYVQKLTGLIPSTADHATVCVPPDCVLVQYPIEDANILRDVLQDLAALLQVDERYLWEHNDTYYVCASHAHALRHEHVQGDLDNLGDELSSYGLLFSNICLALTFLLYATLKQLRNQHGQKIVCMTGTFLCAEVSLWFSNMAGDVGCQVAAVFMHFFFLSAFLWMSVVSFDFAHTFACSVPTSSSHLHCCSSRLVKEAAVCYIGPGLLVLGFVGVHLNPALTGYIHYGRTANQSCWLTTDIAIVIGILLPVGVSLVFNLGCFVVTLVSIERKRMRKTPLNAGRKENGRGGCFHGLLYLKLSFIMGLPWLLSYLAETLQIEWIMFLVAVCNSLQGVVVFLVFVCNRNVYRIIRATWTSWRMRSGKGRSMYRIELHDTGVPAKRDSENRRY
ncbi:hypothetical protein BaRGS_00028436 [Batillaria attramentaria]|uniref:G-protein coupled receptors family 2 profile 2 domain-containing protein n=1 Tax=Batillaria attramentaria TaxID=370345 RepID=A0ABD0K0D5_9CAEN